MASIHSEDVIERVRNKLNAEKVKLWLPPFTTQDGQKGEMSEDFVTNFSQSLNLSKEELVSILEELRQHALKKLAAKRKHQEEGIATVNIRLAGKVPEPMKMYCKGHGLSVEISLLLNGQDLKQQISNKTNMPTYMLKLICGGKVIDDGAPLQSQAIKNSCQMMCLCLGQSEAEAVRKETEAENVAQTRQAAELLASKEDGGNLDAENYYLQIADQNGKPLDLPKEERKALVLAMTLHEKGRAALKRKEHSKALLLLLEADAEFKKCRSDILNAVDNYALVCLDVVWCYFLLRNIDDLPDAETRLTTCDQCLRKSYGPNLERLTLVKGGTGEEKALFMRLHLLQGILAYHQGRNIEAMSLLNRAESELGLLRVDEGQMLQVMEMGFTAQEARLGLRMREGNVQMAIAHIVARREEKKEIKAKEKEEKRKKRLANRLGKTASGDPVKVEWYEQLVDMGFGKGAAAEALRQTNNDISRALQVLQDQPDLLILPDPDPPEVKISDQMLQQVASMGFDMDAARAALHHFQGSMEEAIGELINRGGLVPPNWLTNLPASSSGSSSNNDSPTKTPEETKSEKEAMDRIISDLPQSEDDHLDLALDEEASFLQEYKTLLESSLPHS